MDYRLEYRTPTTAEYQILRGSAAWNQLSDKHVDAALNKSLFSVCVMMNDGIIAGGRIVGDGIYFYVQDVVVLAEYQGSGFGKMIMAEIEQWLDDNAESGSFIGLMAADGTAGFYKSFGYQTRAESCPGMFKRKD